MKSSALLWVVIVGLLLYFAYNWMSKDQDSSMMSDPAADTSEMVETSDQSTGLTIVLSEQSDLGQSGMATLMDNEEGMVVVTLSMEGAVFSTPQPAHIHLGSCPTPGSVKYPLTSVVDGVSETVLDMSLADLLASGEAMAINVHKSSTETSVYTACGDLAMN